MLITRKWTNAHEALSLLCLQCPVVCLLLIIDRGNSNVIKTWKTTSEMTIAQPCSMIPCSLENATLFWNSLIFNIDSGICIACFFEVYLLSYFVPFVFLSLIQRTHFNYQIQWLNSGLYFALPLATTAIFVSFCNVRGLIWAKFSVRQKAAANSILLREVQYLDNSGVTF